MEIEKIVIGDIHQLANCWFQEDILALLGNVSVEWLDFSSNDDQSGIVAVHLAASSGTLIRV